MKISALNYLIYLLDVRRSTSKRILMIGSINIIHLFEIDLNRNLCIFLKNNLLKIFKYKNFDALSQYFAHVSYDPAPILALSSEYYSLSACTSRSNLAYTTKFLSIGACT